MSHQNNCFTPFDIGIGGYQLPKKFNYPYYYQPHALSVIAAKQLQQYLENQSDWQHDFGLNGNSAQSIGKMFGVLVVRNRDNDIGFISAFSGKLAEKNNLNHFVPPVYDMLADDGFFIKKQLEINRLSAIISELEDSSVLLSLRRQLAFLKLQSSKELSAYREHIIRSRKLRKSQRIAAEATLVAKERRVELNQRLNSQSVYQKKTLKLIIAFWNAKIGHVTKEYDRLINEVTKAKLQRKVLSNNLQSQLFSQYQFLNKFGEKKDLRQLFESTVYKTPPAGAGECAAPKLLQYAFLNNLTPIALAEFWWGQSPKSEIRKHGQFYGACLGKCKPILTHMLAGMNVEHNPLMFNAAANRNIEIIYQDQYMVVINKPSELLSVPGKTINDCVYSRMKLLFPEATGPLIVHRLDMSTSGLMVIALTQDVNKALQKQFINRTVSKRYIALLSGELDLDNGIITLPLRVDFDDRPRQLVCYEHGKHAETCWELIDTQDGKSKVYFYPKTGRTHQLRVHSAHYLGLNTPIVGDDLYGERADRLYLHAERLILIHPVTRQEMTFHAEVDF